VADQPDAAEGKKAPFKTKKLLVIVGALVLVLAVAAGGAFYFLKQRAAASDEGEEEAPATAHIPDKPPVYMPLDNMVVNLADPGGQRVAQLGITLVVADEKAGAAVRSFLPTIRSGVLMLVSQRTSEELLTGEGKEKLAKDILREASLPFGGGDDESEDEVASDTGKKKKRKPATTYPVTQVLFSSLIIQ
jgi:flagellar FliL protein